MDTTCIRATYVRCERGIKDLAIQETWVTAGKVENQRWELYFQICSPISCIVYNKGVGTIHLGTKTAFHCVQQHYSILITLMMSASDMQAFTLLNVYGRRWLGNR